jgi:hypothetical protein
MAKQDPEHFNEACDLNDTAKAFSADSALKPWKSYFSRKISAEFCLDRSSQHKFLFDKGLSGRRSVQAPVMG